MDNHFISLYGEGWTCKDCGGFVEFDKPHTCPTTGQTIGGEPTLTYTFDHDTSQILLELHEIKGMLRQLLEKKS